MRFIKHFSLISAVSWPYRFDDISTSRRVVENIGRFLRSGEKGIDFTNSRTREGEEGKLSCTVNYPILVSLINCLIAFTRFVVVNVYGGVLLHAICASESKCDLR